LNKIWIVRKCILLITLKKDFKTEKLFLPFIRWLFENRMMGIMFELKTEDVGGEGCIMLSLIFCTACQVVGNQRKVKKWVRNVACMGVKVVLNRLLTGKWEGKSLLRRPV